MIGQPKRIAIIYDWATSGVGGAERVLQLLHELYPEATLFTALKDSNVTWTQSWQVKTSFLQLIPFAYRWKMLLAPLMPLAFEQFDLSEYEVVISVTSAFAKGVRTTPQQLHVCYLLTPPRFVHTHVNEYRAAHPLLQLPLVSQLVQGLLTVSRTWDTVAAHRPDVMIPISSLVSRRAQSIYQRAMHVPLYPPVTLQPHQTPYSFSRLLPKPFELVVSRLVAYKRIDIALQAARALARNLLIVGQGPEWAKLKQLAGRTALVRQPQEPLSVFFARNQAPQAPRAYFLGHCDDAEISWLYQHAHTVLMPGVEDFGITALEAIRHGTPVVLAAQSGVAELLEDGVHAIYSREESIQSFTEALEKRDTLTTNAPTLQMRALQYDSEIFKKAFQTAVEAEWKEL